MNRYRAERDVIVFRLFSVRSVRPPHKSYTTNCPPKPNATKRFRFVSPKCWKNVRKRPEGRVNDYPHRPPPFVYHVGVLRIYLRDKSCCWLSEIIIETEYFCFSHRSEKSPSAQPGKSVFSNYFLKKLLFWWTDLSGEHRTPQSRDLPYNTFWTKNFGILWTFVRFSCFFKSFLRKFKNRKFYTTILSKTQRKYFFQFKNWSQHVLL